MKYTPVSLAGVAALSALISHGTAFPAIMEKLAQDAAAQQNTKRQGATDPTTTFDAAAQYVSNMGEHAFVPPDFAAGDQRGPCPGLNAMANHGYLPHNGVGSHTDFVGGTEAVFGMSADLSGFLTVLGATLDGNGLQWSIGGPSPALPGSILLGQPQGISGSHNKYESDVSPGRGDLYEYGNDFTLQMSQYQQLYDMGQANGDDYDLDILTTFRNERFQQSINNNPYFFNGPFTGVLVQPAAYTFIYRFMANKSAEYPAGKLNGDVMNSFFGVTKDSSGNLVKNPGMEKIPDNWYKRAIGDEYSIPYLQTDIIAAAQRFPEFLNIGGNLGKVNTFAGVDVTNITGGVYNLQSLSQGNNLACFAMQFAAQASPDMVKCSGALSDVTSVLTELNQQLATSLAGLGCPQLQTIDQDQFKQFPGYSDLNCKSGTY